MTTPHYDAQRDPAHSTYGGATRMRKRNPEVFAAGAQYALDVLLREMLRLPGIDTDLWELIDGHAERILRAAQTQEPLP